MANKTTIFWFRQDLRISDNPGLFEAARNSLVMPIYILEEEKPGSFKIGAASKWWLHNSLNHLNKKLDNKLNVYLGDPREIIPNIIERNNIDSIYWNRCYEPHNIELSKQIKELLKDSKVECRTFNGSSLWEPCDILKNDKTPYKIYSYFYRKGCLPKPAPRDPLPDPPRLELLHDSSNKTTISDLKLLPKIKWYEKLANKWIVGEEAAQNMLEDFLSEGLHGYKENRNFPAKHNVSNLSPYLHFGEISPNQIWYKAQKHLNLTDYSNDLECFLSEIAWREFSYYLLYHFPHMPSKNLNSKFDKFSWDFNQKFLEAWKRGETGYPIVDSGMRQLWQTGYMHNRVRMIVASFLVKNLLIDWRIGADWFWDCLVDADLASNSTNWQWVAGCGVDSAPYFRIFNPIIQSEKFDPDGTYIRQFIPELSKLPNKYLFKPWEAPAKVLKDAGIKLGETYPMPLVDFKLSRYKALRNYKEL